MKFNIKKHLFGPTIFKFIGIPLIHLLYRIKVEGIKNVPRSGPIIIIANHLSYFDAFIISSVLPFRTFFFLADVKMSKLPIFGKLMPKLNCFFVFKESGSHAPIEWNAALVKKGFSTVFFPEGHRSRTGKICPGKIGTGWLIRKTMAPIIPCILWNVQKVMPPGKFLQLGGGPRRIEVRIRFLEEMNFEKERNMPMTKETAQTILDRIMKLLKKERKRLLLDMKQEQQK